MKLNTLLAFPEEFRSRDRIFVVQTFEPLNKRRRENWTLIVSLMLASFLIGGVTFYASMVVPAASSIWGAMDQGFVTRLVTLRFNVAATPCWILMLFWSRRYADRVLTGLLVSLLVIQVGLFLTHYSLDILLDPEQGAVLNESSFYRRHQLYLWLTTAQILMGWGLIWKFCRLLCVAETKREA